MTEPTFERQYQKVRKHLRFTPELMYVLDALADDSDSAYVEAAAWDRLVDDYGEKAVREAIDECQRELEQNDDNDLTRLLKPKQYELQV